MVREPARWKQQPKLVTYQNQWATHDTPEPKVSALFVFALWVSTRWVRAEVANLHHAAQVSIVNIVTQQSDQCC